MSKVIRLSDVSVEKIDLVKTYLMEKFKDDPESACHDIDSFGENYFINYVFTLYLLDHNIDF